MESINPNAMKKTAEENNMKDWNEMNIEEHIEHLGEKFRVDSSGTAKSVFELIEAYKKASQDNWISAEETGSIRHVTITALGVTSASTTKVIIEDSCFDKLAEIEINDDGKGLKIVTPPNK